MAHNIYKYDKHQGVRQAWHGKTEVVPVLTLDQNWLTEWDIVPVTLDKNGQPTKWTVLECSDDPSIEVGQPYNPASFQPISNMAFLNLIRDSLSGTDHVIESVGSLRNRGRIFVSIRLMGMEEFKAAGRKFSAFLNFGNGHDKSSVLWVNTSNICTVCDNTFGFNLATIENKAVDAGDDLRVRQRHTKNAVLKLPSIADVVDKAVGVQGKFKATFDILHEQEMTEKQAAGLFAGFLGRAIPDGEISKGLSTRSLNTSQTLVELFKTGKGNAGRTRADAASAVTDYYSHQSSGKDADVMKQVLSSDYGAGNKAKHTFWTIIQDDDEVELAIDRGNRLLSHTKVKA